MGTEAQSKLEYKKFPHQKKTDNGLRASVTLWGKGREQRAVLPPALGMVLNSKHRASRDCANVNKPAASY